MALARWTGIVQDEQGNAVVGALIEVRREGSGTLQSLFTDREGLVGLSNPFIADNSTVIFHAAGGSYRIKVVLGDLEREWRYVSVGTGAETDAELLQQQIEFGLQNAVSINEQDLAPEAQEQARLNLSVMSSVEVASAIVAALAANDQRLRVYYAQKTDAASTSSTTWVDTGLQVQAQATKAGSSMLIEADLNGIGGGASTNTVQFRLVRDSAVISPVGDPVGSRTQASSELPSNGSSGGATTAHTSLVAIDTPGDTALHTYKVQWRISGGNAFLNRSANDSNADTYSRTASTLTAKEVKKI